MGGLYLTLLIFLPLLFAAVIVAIPAEKKDVVRGLGVLSMAINLLLAIGVWAVFDFDNTGPQMVTRVLWIESFNIEYFVGVDQISFWMVLITAVIGFIAALSS